MKNTLNIKTSFSKLVPAIFAISLIAPAFADSDSVTVSMNKVTEKGTGEPVGTVKIQESKKGGLVFTPDIAKLKPGIHGFHLHTNPSCQPALKNGKQTAAAAAGSHYDPAAEKAHKAPWEEGHKGDLPVLVVDSSGKANTPVFAPKLGMDDIEGRALMIHEGGDNYSDNPAKLGGGGAREACGVIQKS